jgi:hypothetical protein
MCQPCYLWQAAEDAAAAGDVVATVMLSSVPAMRRGIYRSTCCRVRGSFKNTSLAVRRTQLLFCDLVQLRVCPLSAT